LPLLINKVVETVNWLRNTRDPGKLIHLSGHSGGGWTTTICSALMHWFTVKYSCAGESSQIYNDPQDWESQAARSWYVAAGGIDNHHLYAMASRYGKFKMIRNLNDESIARALYRQDSYAALVGRINQDINGYPGEFDLYIDSTGSALHDFSDTAKQQFVDDCDLYE
jgi:hypothetical protein